MDGFHFGHSRKKGLLSVAGKIRGGGGRKEREGDNKEEGERRSAV